MTGIDAAIDAAMRGWCVFPCQPGDKRPMVRDDWERRATADVEAIVRWWPDGANVGIACGPSNLVVVDLDTHGQLPDEWRQPGVRDGLDVFTLLLEWAGESGLPETYWVATPSGGWHLYFAAPDEVEVRNSAGQLGPMVDVRGCGGYVIAAGSVLDGRTYMLLDARDPVPLPGWITRVLTKPATGNTSFLRDGADPDRRLAGLVRTVAEAPEGQRNDTLNWAAFKAGELVAEGHDPVVLADQLVAAACQAGLPEPEARRTVASGMRGAA